LQARMMQASTNGNTYLRRSKESVPFVPAEDFAF
jgi:hypothetical protein